MPTVLFILAMTIVVTPGCERNASTTQLPPGWFAIDSLPADLREAVKTQDITFGCERSLPTRDWSNTLPLPMPLFYDVDGRWSRLGGDTIALFLEYHVIGDAEFTGDGMTPYRLVERIAVDTVELTTTVAQDGSRQYSCPGLTRVYESMAYHQAAPGMYVNQSEFLRLVSVADSIIASQRRAKHGTER
jgi:hypothetical protein